MGIKMRNLEAGGRICEKSLHIDDGHRQRTLGVGVDRNVEHVNIEMSKQDLFITKDL